MMMETVKILEPLCREIDCFHKESDGGQLGTLYYDHLLAEEKNSESALMFSILSMLDDINNRRALDLGTPDGIDPQQWRGWHYNGGDLFLFFFSQTNWSSHIIWRSASKLNEDDNDPWKPDQTYVSPDRSIYLDDITLKAMLEVISKIVKQRMSRVYKRKQRLALLVENLELSTMMPRVLIDVVQDYLGRDISYLWKAEKVICPNCDTPRVHLSRKQTAKCLYCRRKFCPWDVVKKI